MNNVKKMVLVEPRVFETMKAKKYENTPIQNVLSELDEEMNKILTRSDLPSSEKIKLYDQVLQRYMVYKDKLNNTVQKVQIEDKKVYEENEILKGFPNQYLSKAKQLVNFIKSNSSIGWNNTGELMFDEKPIPNTNIRDLVYTAVQKSQPQSKPNGWKVFQGALSALQAPDNFIAKESKPKRKAKSLKWEPY